jgi:hypothetical protein
VENPAKRPKKGARQDLATSELDRLIIVIGGLRGLKNANNLKNDGDNQIDQVNPNTGIIEILVYSSEHDKNVED